MSTASGHGIAIYVVRRVTAVAVDLILLSAGFAFFASLAGYERSIMYYRGEPVFPTAEIAAATLIGALYFSAFEGSDLQASPGKLIAKLRVVRADGEPPGFGRAFLRGFLKMAAFAVVPLWPSLLLPLFTRGRRAGHDMLAKCRVVGR